MVNARWVTRKTKGWRIGGRWERAKERFKFGCTVKWTWTKGQLCKTSFLHINENNTHLQYYLSSGLYGLTTGFHTHYLLNHVIIFIVIPIIIGYAYVIIMNTNSSFLNPPNYSLDNSPSPIHALKPHVLNLSVPDYQVSCQVSSWKIPFSRSPLSFLQTQTKCINLMYSVFSHLLYTWWSDKYIPKWLKLLITGHPSPHTLNYKGWKE